MAEVAQGRQCWPGLKVDAQDLGHRNNCNLELGDAQGL